METINGLCQQKHSKDIINSELVKRFYSCKTCGRSTYILLQNKGSGLPAESVTLPSRRCENCKCNNWMVGRNSFGGSSSDEKLILSASEWTTTTDVDTMNVRLGVL